WVREKATARIAEAVKSPDKQAREEQVDAVREEVAGAYLEAFGEEAYELRKKEIGEVFDRILKEEVRRMITEEGVRPDGRKLDEIRPVSCEVGILPRVHGSGLFQRGQTQVCTT